MEQVRSSRLLLPDLPVNAHEHVSSFEQQNPVFRIFSLHLATSLHKRTLLFPILYTSSGRY